MRTPADRRVPAETTSVRGIRADDMADVLRLNEHSVNYLSPLDANGLAGLVERAAFHKIVRCGGKAAAFLLAFDQNAEYDSPNFLWFQERYPSFLYIDRVVVGEEFRRRGLAYGLYRRLFRFAADRRYAYVTCEIDIEPANDGSLRFHERFGFREVGRQWIRDGTKQVSLCERRLFE